MVWFYDNPNTLDYSKLDEPIRELCKYINTQMKWLRTEESCCGHPDPNEAYNSAWGAFDKLYLRLCVLDGFENRIISLFELIDKIWQGCKGLQWHVSLSYDRKDSDGYHFYFYFDYGKELSQRQMAIDFVQQKIMELTGG